MATEVTNYQCPSCTGPLHFSSNSGNLDCSYCGESFDVATIELLYSKKEDIRWRNVYRERWFLWQER